LVKLLAVTGKIWNVLGKRFVTAAAAMAVDKVHEEHFYFPDSAERWLGAPEHPYSLSSPDTPRR
jgi:hypothetical protein